MALFACEFWQKGKDCGKGLCPQYVSKENCVGEWSLEEMEGEQGFHIMHEVA